MSVPLLALISFFITFIAFVPFINLLYKLKLKDPNPGKHRDVFGKITPIFQKLRSKTSGTPIGGGLLIVLVVTILSVLYFQFIGEWNTEILGILVTFVAFMLLGLFDDLKKTFHFKAGPFELRVRHKFALELIISFVITSWLVNEGAIHISIPGLFDITNKYLLIILSSVGMTFMLNAYNITDGVDGLAGGTLAIALVGILGLASLVGNDTVSIFTSLLFGGLVAYLYFNIYPARLLMGDSGSLAFGSVLCLLLLIMDMAYLIPILGLLYIIEGLSSLIQWAARRFFDRKVFDAAPLHYHLENRGWPQTKVTMRCYLIQTVLVLVALSLVF